MLCLDQAFSSVCMYVFIIIILLLLLLYRHLDDTLCFWLDVIFKIYILHFSCLIENKSRTLKLQNTKTPKQWIQCSD